MIVIAVLVEYIRNNLELYTIINFENLLLAYFNLIIVIVSITLAANVSLTFVVFGFGGWGGGFRPPLGLLDPYVSGNQE